MIPRRDNKSSQARIIHEGSISSIGQGAKSRAVQGRKRVYGGLVSGLEDNFLATNSGFPASETHEIEFTQCLSSVGTPNPSPLNTCPK